VSLGGRGAADSLLLGLGLRIIIVGLEAGVKLGKSGRPGALARRVGSRFLGRPNGSVSGTAVAVGGAITTLLEVLVDLLAPSLAAKRIASVIPS